MQDFCPRINMLKVFFLNNPAMNYGLSISAEIILSKSIFYIKNRLNFFKKKNSFKNINFTLDLFALNLFKLQHSQFVSL